MWRISVSLSLSVFSLWYSRKQQTTKKQEEKKGGGGVAERVERDGQTAEKQIQCGICQRFTMKQKRPLHARDQERVRAKQWPLTHRWQKQAPALCTDYCPYLCVFHSEAEWEAEFAYRQVMILSKTTRLDYTTYKHWVSSEHWAVGCCQRTTQAWAIRWIPATDAVVLL